MWQRCLDLAIQLDDLLTDIGQEPIWVDGMEPPWDDMYLLLCKHFMEAIGSLPTWPVRVERDIRNPVTGLIETVGHVVKEAHGKDPRHACQLAVFALENHGVRFDRICPSSE